MRREPLKAELEGIRHLLSHLNGEITALEESYSQLLSALRRFEGAANLDDLTGLKRRKAFFETWEKLIQECQRLGEDCGVILIDIDHFKSINDTHGHPTGDEVIKRLAELLKGFESPRIVAGRYGGEEFAIAIRGHEAEMVALAEFIRRGAERLHGPVVPPNSTEPSNVEWRCTVSLGLATSKKLGFDKKTLVQHADEALYVAKRKGRNQVRAAS